MLLDCLDGDVTADVPVANDAKILRQILALALGIEVAEDRASRVDDHGLRLRQESVVEHDPGMDGRHQIELAAIVEGARQQSGKRARR